MEIVALVGESIPEVMFGLAAVIFIIILYGRIADWRKWQLGFYVESFCLIVVFLTEALVVLWSFFQYSERDSNAIEFWDALDDHGKSVIMANWQCCGWSAACNAVAGQGIYWTFRAFKDTLCYNATASDYKAWNDNIMLYLGIFAGFHLLFTAIPCVCQAKRRRWKSKQKVKRGVAIWKVEDMIRKESELRDSERQSDVELTPGKLIISNSTMLKVAPEPEREIIVYSSGDQFSPSNSRDFASTSDTGKQVDIELANRSSVRINTPVSNQRQANENSTEDDESHHIDQQGASPVSSDAVRADRLPKPGNEHNEPSVIALGHGKHKHNLSADSNGGGASPTKEMSTSVMPVFWGDSKDSPKQSQNMLPNIPDALPEENEDEDGAESTNEGEPEANATPAHISNVPYEEKINGNAEATEAKLPPPPPNDMSAKDSLISGDNNEVDSDHKTMNEEPAQSGDGKVPPPLPGGGSEKKELPTEEYEDGGDFPPPPPKPTDLNQLQDGMEDDQEDVQEELEDRTYK